MNPTPKAIFVHDTKRIISANDGACELFRCESWQLLDRDLLDFVPEYLRDLTRINLYTTQRGRGSLVKTRQYDFVRCDHTVFAAAVDSRLLENGNFETSVTYRYEVGKL